MTTETVASPSPRPRPAAGGGVRVGDRERERVAARLAQALSQGYLSIGEYETRTDAAIAARTVGALDELMADLPVDRIRRHDPQRRAALHRAARTGVRIHLAAYLGAAALMLGIWAVTGGYFWPIWPLLGWGIGMACHAGGLSACGAPGRSRIGEQIARSGRPYWR